MGLKEFQEKYSNLLEKNPKKTKFFTQWKHADLDKNKNFLFSSEEEILSKLKKYMDTWNDNSFYSLKKLITFNLKIIFFKMVLLIYQLKHHSRC